ncbi:hypothetical protein VPH35_029879 [Triticum aestivum]
MANHVALLLLLSLQLTASFSQQPGDDPDFRTLLKIKEQFDDQAALVSLHPGTDQCNWAYAHCNQDRRVVAIFLQNLHTISIHSIPGLHGPIPDTFGKLSHLSIFNIMRASVSGSLPASLSRTNLTSVSFFSNKLTGRIPSDGAPDRPLGLTLTNNRLTGPIPRTYAGQRYFMNFRVANNMLTGDAAFLFGRQNTVYDIDLSGNRLRFNLTGLKKLTTLDLSYNQLCGEIPTGGNMGRFKPEAYEHNKCLCGTPLPTC